MMSSGIQGMQMQAGMPGGMSGMPGGAALPEMLPEEQRYYELCWTRVALDHTGRLGGKPAFDFLSLSRLPKDALKRRDNFLKQDRG